LGVKRIESGSAIGRRHLHHQCRGQPDQRPRVQRSTRHIAGPDTRYFNFLTPDGTFHFDNAVGTTVRLTQTSLRGDFKIADGFKVEENARYRTSWTRRNASLPIASRTH